MYRDIRIAAHAAFGKIAVADTQILQLAVHLPKILSSFFGGKNLVQTQPPVTVCRCGSDQSRFVLETSHVLICPRPLKVSA